MSALEPDGPADHIFPAAEDAIRAWCSHRMGKPASRPGLGKVRGKSATIGDIVRVGGVLTELGHLHRGELTASGKNLRAWAYGFRKRCDDRGFESVVQRLVRHLRSMRIVAKATRTPLMVRERSQDSDGNVGFATICVESS